MIRIRSAAASLLLVVAPTSFLVAGCALDSSDLNEAAVAGTIETTASTQQALEGDDAATDGEDVRARLTDAAASLKNDLAETEALCSDSSRRANDLVARMETARDDLRASLDKANFLTRGQVRANARRDTEELRASSGPSVELVACFRDVRREFNRMRAATALTRRAYYASPGKVEPSTLAASLVLQELRWRISALTDQQLHDLSLTHRWDTAEADLEAMLR